MGLREFKKMVKSEFGSGLEHATPANVRDFIDNLDNKHALVDKLPSRIIINEPCTSYEEVIKDFFAQVLELPPEEAVVALWTLALDLAFADIESQFDERFAKLFPETD